MDQTSINREFVRRHFEAVNRRDVQTVLGNMRPDLYDHEIEGDHKNDLDEGAQRLQVLMKQVPDLAVDVRDVIADRDKIVVRARMVKISERFLFQALAGAARDYGDDLKGGA